MRTEVRRQKTEDGRDGKKKTDVASRTRCLFISFEGIEGTGKTTQAKMLATRLKKSGYDVILTQEPGGTAIGKKIREVLLHPGHDRMSYMSELLLYYADRVQHLSEKIRPALGKGKIVITDRFTDSTLAYQGYGREIKRSLILSLDRFATGGTRPDLTLLFDLDVETGLKRNRKANKIDRLELEDISFHKKVRDGFLMIAEQEPKRVKIVDASKAVEDISEEVWAIVNNRISESRNSSERRFK